jgi:hypothetical protein
MLPGLKFSLDGMTPRQRSAANDIATISVGFQDCFYLFQTSTFNIKAAAYQETVMEIKEAIC